LSHNSLDSVTSGPMCGEAECHCGKSVADHVAPLMGTEHRARQEVASDKMYSSETHS
jgi:hypothetical protein